MQAQAAQLEDLPAIERLSLEQFPVILDILDLPFDILLDTLIRLRMAEPRPTDGIFVLKDNTTLLGMVFLDTHERAYLPITTQLRYTRHLGWYKALRLLIILRFQVYRPRPDEAYMNGLAVSPAARKRGIGNMLMEYVEQQARLLGKPRLISFVAKTNQPSLQLMFKRGWRVVEQPSTLRPWRKRRSDILRLEKAE